MSTNVSNFNAVNDQPSTPPPGNQHAPGPGTHAGDAPEQELIPVEVRDHAIYQLVLYLGTLLSVPCDIIHLAQLLSLVAGKMSLPIHLDIVTGSLGADLLFTSRILQLEKFGRIDTTSDLRRGEVERFRGFAVLLIRGSHPRLFREATELTTQIFNELHSIPSVWRISDSSPRFGGVGPALTLMADQTPRDFTGFGTAFGTAPQVIQANNLRAIIEPLPIQPKYECPFQEALKAEMKPENKMIAERLLLIVTVVREMLTNKESPAIATIDDYRCLRSLLTKLPVVGPDVAISPQALETAEILQDYIGQENYQCPVPDLSNTGHKWFDRRTAQQLSGKCYNTAKAYINEMIDAGLVITSDEEGPRGRGIKQHYRFLAPTQRFAAANPFEALPSAEEIAAVCKDVLQS